MTPLSMTEEHKSLARRITWFEQPEQAVSDPVQFLAYAMTYATYEECISSSGIETIARSVSEDQ